MLNTQKLVIDHLALKIETVYQQSYGVTDPPFGEIAAWVARLALENIANSDMLYHNMEHTIQVTLVGLTIIQGKHLCEGGVTPRDWFHYVAALLCHDVGYVRGVCRGDRAGEYVTGVGDETIRIPQGGTDAALTPYHVDRSQAFVRERFGPQALRDIDAERIAGYIEMTRFPAPAGEHYRDTKGYAGLVRAADFVGQLGDPNYLTKIPALFYEFEETGANANFGYTSPEDLRQGFARFYWTVISPYIQDALRYLYATQEGRQWAANLYSQVFAVEHGAA